MFTKENILFVILGGFFISNAIIAEFIGVKIFSLEATLGAEPLHWNIFGIQGNLDFTAGVLLWPIVFIMTDIINEYFGKKGVQLLSFLTVVLISYAFLMVYMAIGLAPAEWWIGINQDKQVDNMQIAFANILGQGLWIIGGSLVAFFVGQILDVYMFHYLRKFTGSSKIWFRATGSTLVSQLIDSFVVLYIAFVIGPQHWDLSRFIAVGTVNYSYKVIVAILLTPMLYVLHWAIDNYLGKDRAEALIQEAAKSQ